MGCQQFNRSTVILGATGWKGQGNRRSGWKGGGFLLDFFSRDLSWEPLHC